MTIWNIGISRQEIIFPIHLHAVASVVEKRNRAGIAQSALKLGDGVEHLLSVPVAHYSHSETQSFQRGPQFSRIGTRMRQPCKVRVFPVRNQ
jgi:hypothetical protein